MEKRKDNIRKAFYVDGVRHWVRGATEEECIRKMIAKEAELRQGVIDSNMTVEQWAAVWMETYIEPRDITEASKEMYREKLRLYILPALGSTRLNRANPTQLQRIMNQQTGRSTSAVSKLRIVLKAMFRQAYLDRLLPYNPAEGLQMPRTVTGKHRSLTVEERVALLEAVKEVPQVTGAWALSMLYCGLRPGETAALRWEDVNLKTATMCVRHAKEAHGSGIKAPKTASGIRSIPIPAVYLRDLKALPHTSEYVFPQRDGSALTDSAMKRRWETVKKYMDISLGAETRLVKTGRKSSLVITGSVIADDLDLYCLRHTYCTDLQKAGVPINVAKELMGHSDITVTANIYTHATTESLEMARQLIDKKPVGTVWAQKDSRNIPKLPYLKN